MNKTRRIVPVSFAFLLIGGTACASVSAPSDQSRELATMVAETLLAQPIRATETQIQPTPFPTASPQATALASSDLQSTIDSILLSLSEGSVDAIQGLTLQEYFGYAVYLEGNQPATRDQLLADLTLRLPSEPRCGSILKGDNVVVVWTVGWTPNWEVREICYEDCTPLEPPHLSDNAGFFLSNEDGGWVLRALWIGDMNTFVSNLPAGELQVYDCDTQISSASSDKNGLSGIWEGPVTTRGEYYQETNTELYEIKDDCEASAYCLDVIRPEEPEYRNVPLDLDYTKGFSYDGITDWKCFIETFQFPPEPVGVLYQWCFSPQSDGSLRYAGHGGLSSSDGILYRVEEGSEISGSEPTLIATEVLVVKPTGFAGTDKHGSCWTNSLSVWRPDAWRCMTEAGGIIDPCFSMEGEKHYVVCGISPRDTSSGYRLVLTEPLPPPMNNIPDYPWMFDLEDGVSCGPGPQGTSLFPNVSPPVFYLCSEKWVILGTPKEGEIWTAVRAKIAADMATVIEKETVNIRIVWK